MADQELDTNEAILAELKKMNDHLAQIRIAADHYMKAVQGQKDALRAIQNMRGNLPRI